jgi:hypothetical protein
MATETLDRSPDVARRRERLVALCQGLPQATAERAGVQHLAFKVCKKVFAYYAYDHHGDGRSALLCKAPPGEQSQLVAEDPERYFVPPYVGPGLGWPASELSACRLDGCQNLLSVAYVLLRQADSQTVRAGKATSRESAAPPNKEVKLTKPGQNEASQLISGVGRTFRRSA